MQDRQNIRKVVPLCGYFLPFSIIFRVENEDLPSALKGLIWLEGQEILS